MVEYPKGYAVVCCDGLVNRLLAEALVDAASRWRKSRKTRNRQKALEIAMMRSLTPSVSLWFWSFG
jgi:serine/threonine protein phosphatase PrpC